MVELWSLDFYGWVGDVIEGSCGNWNPVHTVRHFCVVYDVEPFGVHKSRRKVSTPTIVPGWTTRIGESDYLTDVTDCAGIDSGFVVVGLTKHGDQDRISLAVEYLLCLFLRSVFFGSQE